MKVGLLSALLGMMLLVPLVCYPASRTGPFRIRVVDDRTGAGVPNARVTVESGATGTTEFDGSVVFWMDTALMNRTVSVTIEQRGFTTTDGTRVTPGGVVWMPVPAP
jgi:hypothetical protein